MIIERKTINVAKEYFSSWDFLKYVWLSYIIIHIVVLKLYFDSNIINPPIIVFFLFDIIYFGCLIVFIGAFFHKDMSKIYILFFWLSHGENDSFNLTFKNPHKKIIKNIR